MLKGKNFTDEAVCSLSSCRTKAETLARSVNSRLWPNTWGTVGEAVSNGIREQEDEEFFDTSPSPVEEEGCDRRDDSSAATVAGRAKLLELLQQHAVDDVTDVFYDVSENVDVIGENHEANSSRNLQSGEVSYFDKSCLNDSQKKSEVASSVEKFEIDSREDVVSESHYESIVSENLEKIKIKDLESVDICENTYDVSRNVLKNVEAETSIFYNEISCENSPQQNLNNSSLDCESLNHVLPNSSRDDNDSIKHDDNLFSFKEPLPLANSHDASETCHFSGADNQNSLISCDLENSESLVAFTSNPIQVIEKQSDSVNDQESNNSCGADNQNSSVELESSVPPDEFTSTSIQIREEKSSPVLSPTHNELTNVPKTNDPRRLEVFGEFRPIISRSTSLKTGKTPPGTPGRKKIVRFADVLGLDLEDVRHIISGDLPNIPSSAYNDLVLAEEEKPERPPTTIELKSRHQGVWENIQSATGPNVLFPTFAIPGQQADFHNRLQAQGICLESVIVSDFSVQCTCRVMNWGFSKKVRARYTVNKWLTSNDIEASYVSGSTQYNTDAFTFNIFLPPSYSSVEFALCYSVNGKEYWDNNRGTNYILSCHVNTNTIQASVPNSPTWVHQFW